MGNEFEAVKDSEGNRHLIFDESSLYDDSQIGDKESDFEILQVLSERDDDDESAETFTCVEKVRSLNNHKIYAMKIIDLNKINYKNDLKEVLEKLKQLNNPHIIKYYKYFFEQDKNNGINNVYIIMEFMNNSDIKGFIKAHQVLNEKIKEEEIWNILLQCTSAMDYLHSQNLGGYGIRFFNILMNNQQNAKIGVFNNLSLPSYSYDPKEDVFELGKYFNNMIFSENPTVKFNLDKEIKVIREQNNDYSKELIDILNKMINSNPSMRPNFSDLYQEIKQEYMKKFTKNESIKAVLRCLYSFNLLNNVMFNSEELFKNNKEKYYINYWYTNTIKAFSQNNNANIKECVDEFRRALASDNSLLDGNREVDPLFLTAFLLEKMHKEMNVIKKDNESKENKTGKYVITSVVSGEEEDRTNKEQMLHKFKTYYNENINSKISDFFFGFVKTKRNCQTCRTGNYSFSNFCFVFFDLSENNNKNFDIVKNGFEFQFNDKKILESDSPERVYCERCMTYQNHVEFNRYYMMNHLLIICFIRGNEYKDKSKVIFGETLDLSPVVDMKNNAPTKYELVGCITRDNDSKFQYYSKIPKSNEWISRDKKIEKPNFGQLNEQVIMLFYNDINSNQYLI